tara:strand:- start:1060 stop:1476 length:417 start_codon:yes stop_codon:yes gene_type:complete
MIEKFNGIIYLIIFIIHFIGYAVYAYRCVFATQSFLDQYGVDNTGAVMTRFFGSLFIGAFIMAMYIMLIRDGGVQGTWGFFNLIFMQNLSAFIVGIYTIKINKLGHTEKTSIEGIIAPGVLTLLSAILIYGLADKIYT